MLLNLAEHTVSVNDPRQIEQDKLIVRVLKVKSIRFITMENFGNVEDLTFYNEYISIIISRNRTQFFAQYVQCISQLHVSAHFRPPSGCSSSL